MSEAAYFDEPVEESVVDGLGEGVAGADGLFRGESHRQRLRLPAPWIRHLARKQTRLQRVRLHAQQISRILQNWRNSKDKRLRSLAEKATLDIASYVIKGAYSLMI